MYIIIIILCHGDMNNNLELYEYRYTFQENVLVYAAKLCML